MTGDHAVASTWDDRALTLTCRVCPGWQVEFRRPTPLDCHAARAMFRDAMTVKDRHETSGEVPTVAEPVDELWLRLQDWAEVLA